MSGAVKKTISLPTDLPREAEELARSEGKTLSAVIQDALGSVRRQRLGRELPRRLKVVFDTNIFVSAR